MIERIIKYILAFVGLSVGAGAGFYLGEVLNRSEWFNLPETVFTVVVPGICSLSLGLAAYFASRVVIKRGKKLAAYVQAEIEKLPPTERIVGLIGLVIGLFVAFLISGLYDIIPLTTVANGLRILTYLFLGYFGIITAQKFSKEPFKWQEWFERSNKEKTKAQTPTGKKILDTSVIIDGRIYDICKTGFLEGELIVAEFVLGELRHIADSSDALKRNRGRRGLDILKLLQSEPEIAIKIVDDDFDDVQEVDIKLIKLAQKIGGSILTNDYNLNKVAVLQKVKILNINELSNAIKPVMLPGEEMTIQIIKEGKENNQGIGYLDDGTMIVVEDGKKHIQQTREVVVTSVLQTAAGRMIFAKLKV